MTYLQFHRFLLIVVCCAVVATLSWAAFYFGIVLQLGLAVIALALLWIGAELHRIANLTVNFIAGFEDGIRRRKREIEQGK